MNTSDVEELSPLKRAIIEIRELKSRLAAAERRQHEPIAVVGIGLRFPGGADDPESFWRLLWDGVDAIGEVPANRWSADALYDVDPDAPGKMNTRWGGFLDDIDLFDAAFFAISPREAESLDPQQRLLLEVTWEALEHAGIPTDTLFAGNAGMFVGIGNSDYMRLLLADRQQIDTYTTTGNALSIAAGRLSYVLGAQGPAIALDTACSSSLVAVHLAVQALRNGETDLALAGGVNLILTPELTINFSRARMMAPDGRCKTFDAGADGYVRSEGCAMVVLKRLRDAEADGDRILAVIRGSAVNQDGRSGGLTAPNGPSQEHVVAAALADAGAAADDISYVEAHGTGTLLGDPIEVGALGAVLCCDRSPDRPLRIGSVKTNIGHTETAAGIAGLVKVVLMLQNRAIPPHLHLAELNPHIAAAGLAIEVPTVRTAWTVGDGARLAGVSSFGLSGTNAHVIVGEYAPPIDRAAATTLGRTADILTLSAKSAAALHALVDRFADHLAEHPDESLDEIARSANTGRAHLRQRLAIVASDAAGAARQLAAFSHGRPAPGAQDTFVSTADLGGSARGGLAFLFTGHGSHYRGMGRQLYSAEPVFAAAIDRCEQLLRGELDRSVSDILFGEGQLLDQMLYAQPALFSMQYALTELWASWGVRPAMVAGHSAGEYVAAVVAGVMSLADGLRVIAARGRLMESLADGGEMVALFVDEATVAGALAGCTSDIGIAAVNGPSTTVVSGTRDAIRALIAQLRLDDDELRRLDVSVAAHSPLVEPILDDFAEVVASVDLSRPSIGLVSSTTGHFVADELTATDYWRRHLREPVRFAAVFETLRDAGCTTFLEIGPQTTLLALGRRNWPDAAATWVPSMCREIDESRQITTSLATLYAGGFDVDWASFHRSPPGGPRPKVDLPTYPWQRSSYWSPAARSSGDGSLPVSPRWRAAAEAAELQSGQGPLDLRPETYPERWALLDRFAGASIIDAFRELGLFTTDGETHSVDDLIDGGHVAAGFEHVAARWLGHLVDDGLLTVDGDVFTAARALPAADDRNLLAAAAPAFAGIEPLVDYVHRCGDSLAAVVSGRESALNTLFPGGSYETVDFNYANWAVPRYFNAIVRSAVAAVAFARPGQPIRILEVGAGTGGTTAAVLPGVPADRTSYTFTDISDFFLRRAEERFVDYPFVRYAQLDLEQAPDEQGYTLGSYDIVIAANVVHATRDLDATLERVRSLLVPGGVLLLYEGTEHPRWFDITIGLIEGWQLFDDGWRTDVPLMDPDRWARALDAAGFDAFACYPPDDSPTAILLNRVMVARAGGEESRCGADLDVVDGVDDTTTSTPSGSGFIAPRAGDARSRVAEALPDERHDVLVDVVRQAIAYVLRLADGGRLHRDQALLDLGLDSLMAVELRDVLHQTLALDRKLPATLVFDQPTIGAIATYLERTMNDTPADAEVRRTDGVGSTAQPIFEPLEVATVADLSDDEVEAMLLQRLTELEQ